MGDSCFSVVCFVDADHLQIYLHDVPGASTSVSDTAVFNTVDAFLKCCVRC